MHGDAQQHAVALVFGQRAAPLELARLRIKVFFRLLDEVEGDGQRDVADVVEGRQKFDAFDVAVKAVAPMPTDNVVFIGERLATDAVIDTQGGFGALNGAHQRFDLAPQIGTILGFGRKQPRHLIVTDLPVKHPGQAGGGGRAKGANQVVRVEVEKFLAHLSSLHCASITA